MIGTTCYGVYNPSTVGNTDVSTEHCGGKPDCNVALTTCWLNNPISPTNAIALL